MPYDYEEQKKGVIRFRDNVNLNEDKTKTLNMIPDGSSYMTGFFSMPENREWLGSKFFGEKGLLDEEAVGKMYDAKIKVSELFRFDDATPEQLWGDKYKNVADAGEKEILYLGEIYKKTLKMDSKVQINPFTSEGILKEEKPMVCLESREKMNDLAKETVKYQAAQKCNGVQLRGALDDVIIKAKKKQQAENVSEMASDEAKIQEEKLIRKGKELIHLYLNGTGSSMLYTSPEEVRKELEALQSQAASYLKNKAGFGAKDEVEKTVSNLNTITNEVIEKENQAQEKLNSDLLMDESGKTYSDASLKEKQELCKELEEKGIVEEFDPAVAEKEYVQSELENINANELVGKAAEKSAGDNGMNKNAANAGDYILGRFDDNVNHGVEPDAHDLARVKNFDASMDYLSDSQAFQKMMDERGLKYVKKVWPEVEKESEAVRERCLKEIEEFKEAEEELEAEIKAEVKREVLQENEPAPEKEEGRKEINREKDFSDKVSDAFDKLDNGTEQEKNEAINEAAREGIEIAGDMKDNQEELEYNLNQGNFSAALDNVGNLFDKGKVLLKAGVKNSGSMIKLYAEYSVNPEGASKKFENVELDDDNKQRLNDRLGINADNGMQPQGEPGAEQGMKHENPVAEKAAEEKKKLNAAPEKAEEKEPEAAEKKEEKEPEAAEKKEEKEPEAAEKKEEKEPEKNVEKEPEKDSEKKEEKEPEKDQKKPEKKKSTEREYVEGKDPKDLDGQYERYSERTVNRLIAEDPKFGRKLADAMAVEKVEKKGPRAEKEFEKKKTVKNEIDKEQDLEANRKETEPERRERERQAGMEKNQASLEQKEGLLKYRARERLALNMLKDMPKGYEQDGKINTKKLKCVTQILASEYVRQHPKEFENTEDMHRFTQRCYANKDLQAALLRICEEKSGQEIMDMVREKKLASALKDAVDKNKADFDKEKEQKYFKDAQKIKVPKFKKESKDNEELSKKGAEKEKEDTEEKQKEKAKKDPKVEKEKEIEEKKDPQTKKEDPHAKKEEAQREKEESAIYEKVKKSGAKVFKDDKALEGAKKEESYKKLGNGRSGVGLVDSMADKQNDKKQQKLGKKNPKLSEPEKPKDLTPEQQEGLQKFQSRGRTAEEKLKTMPSGYKIDGKINSEKIKCMTQLVASEYIERHPEKFRGIADMNRFIKDFYSNNNVKAAILRVAEKHTGEDLIDMIHSKGFAKEFEKALETTKKMPESAAERKEKRTYMQDAEKLKAPVLKEELEAFKQKQMQQTQQKGAARAM